MYNRKYRIPDDVLQAAKSGAHLKRLCDAIMSDPPAPRTCRRYFSSVTSPPSVKRFVVSAAQCNTRVNRVFIESLETYCRINNAELIISGIQYNTPGDVQYDVRIQKYIMNKSRILAKGLVFCGELNISPTAADPLSGMDSYCIGDSGILPHTKLRVKSLPRIRGDEPAFLFTTGVVTNRNYTVSKAGQKASFHHVHGALVVEVDADGEWFVRQIVADSTGGFYDLNKFYRMRGCIDSDVQAVTWGDVHFPNESQHFWRWVTEIEDALSPRKHFIHDVYDFYVRNHHNISNPVHTVGTLGYPVESEFMQMESRIKKLCHAVDGDVFIVPSNHDAAFGRWLRDADYRKDVENAAFYFKCQSLLYNTTGFPASVKSEFIHVIKSRGRTGRAVFIQPDSSVCLCADSSKPIECAVHGHAGINGSRGAPVQFTKIGRRIITGHTHSSGVIDGVYTVGTSTPLTMEYTTGPSSWSNTHCITYWNGKRCLITCKGKKWRAV